MLLMHANNREEIKEACAGDIVALVGLKNTTTGDTLCDQHKPVMLERMEFPEPVIEVAVEPKTEGRPGEAGHRARRGWPQEDPSFRVGTDQEIGPDHDQGHGRAPPRDHRRPPEARVQGRGQCRRAAGGLPRDDHRAGPRSTTRTRSRPAAPASSPASSCVFEPGEKGTGFVFENKVVGGSVPKEYIPGVAEGPRGVACRVACSPASRWSTSRSTLIDGAYHDVDSSALAFEIAVARGLHGGHRRRPARSCSSRS